MQKIYCISFCWGITADSERLSGLEINTAGNANFPAGVASFTDGSLAVSACLSHTKCLLSKETALHQKGESGLSVSHNKWECEQTRCFR